MTRTKNTEPAGCRPQGMLERGADPSVIADMTPPALVAALSAGDTKAAHKLLDAGMELRGEALVLAIRHAAPDVVRRIIDAGAPTERTLHIAARRGDVDILDMVLAAGETCDLWRDNPPDTNEDDVTPRDVATDPVVRERLRGLMVGSRPSPERRHLPADRLTGLAKRLVAEGPDSRLLPTRSEREARQPLHCAVKSGHHEAVQLLIEYGAALRADPLSDEWRDETVLPLVRKQSSAAATEWRGDDPPTGVAMRGLKRFALLCNDPAGGLELSRLTEDEALRESEEHPANAHYVGAMTPLHFAAANDMPRVVVALVERGAYLEKGTHNGQRPLHFAAKSAGPETVRVLVQAGANLEVFPYNSPLATAAEYGNIEAIRALLEAGANPNPRDRWW